MSDYFSTSFTANATATLWVDSVDKDRLVVIGNQGNSFIGYTDTTVTLELQASGSTQPYAVVLPAGMQLWGTNGALVGVLVTKSTTSGV